MNLERRQMNERSRRLLFTSETRAENAVAGVCDVPAAFYIYTVENL